MFSLKLESVGARTLMTVISTGMWLAVASYKNGHYRRPWLIVIFTLAMCVPLCAWLGTILGEKLKAADSSKRRRMTTVFEFVLYASFITLVTYQSVDLAESQKVAFWFGVPTSLTIGIIPQIVSWLNRLYSILISLIVYAAVLYKISTLSHFYNKDIVYYYALLAVTAFSKEFGDLLLQGVSTGLKSLHFIAGKTKDAISNFESNDAT